jgi:aminopeptidase N
MRYPVRHVARAILITVLFTLAACAPASAPVAPAPTVQLANIATTAPPPTAAPASPAPTAAPAMAAPTAAPVQQPASEPAPIFGPAWGEREIYRPGLIEAEQATLDALHGASEYRIQLEISPAMTAVSGRQQVRYTNRESEALDEIYMRLFPNALGGKMTVYDVAVNGQALTARYEFERTAIRVPLPAPLQPRESVVIDLRYDIEVPETLEAGYGLLGYTDKVLALDTPYAAIPVYNDEGWNVETPPATSDTSFNDASFYLARVTAPAGLVSVTTGVEVDRQRSDDTSITTYALGPARDFYLAASEDYTMATRQVGGTRINSYALPGGEERRDLALDVAAAALRIFSARLGPYPYTEFDVVATPMLALGIEYPGAVGISTRVYDTSDAELARVLESTVAHEVAHQWFYNLVGSDQIDEPWLDEALTQYATWLYFRDEYGESAAQAWRDNWSSRWDRVERAQKPVGLPAAEYEPREYGAIVYGRGPIFLSALAERMGQEEFDAFLGEYARGFRWEIASAEDFKQQAEDACACQLDDLYAEWLEPPQ